MTTAYLFANGGFYPLSEREAYEYAGTWPDDGVEVTDASHRDLLDEQARGASIEIVDGMVEAVFPNAPTLNSIRATTIDAISAWRDQQEAAGVEFSYAGHNYDGGNNSRL